MAASLSALEMSFGVAPKPILPSPMRPSKGVSIPTPKFAFGRHIFIEKVKVRGSIVGAPAKHHPVCVLPFLVCTLCA
jgi:hypothetical protein